MKNTLIRTRTEKLLLEAARLLNNTLEYEVLVEEVLKLVMTAAKCEAALIFRVDHQRTDLKFRFMKTPEYVMQTHLRDFGNGVPKFIEQFREPVIIDDAASDPRNEHDLENLMGIKIRSLVSVPLVGKGQMIGVIMVFNKLEEIFTATDVDMLVGLSHQIAVAVDNASLIRAIKREALEKNLLYEIGKKLSNPLEVEDLLTETLELLKQVVQYDAAGVFLIDSEGVAMESTATFGYEEEDDRLELKIGQGLIGTVAKSGEAVIVPDVSKDPHYVNAHDSTRSEIVVPIRLNNRVIGVFNLESEVLNAYTKHDLDLLEAFASQAAVSIERARLQRRLMTGRIIEQQLKIARDIQRTFLPDDDPKIAGYDIAGLNVASGQVGGDYYDFIRIVDHQTGVAIADVSGKGIPAALIMASFRASMIAEIRNNYSIRTICQKVNNLMLESLQPGMYVTGVYGVLDSRNHIFTFANCGHNLPILLRASGEVEYLREGGPILGIAKDAVYEERPIFLFPNDIVMLYTDGVIEVFNEKGEEFGMERLIKIVQENRSKTAGEIEEIVHAAVREFAAEEHQFDDLTMIVMKRLRN